MSERPALLAALRQFGADAVSFMALESGMRHWSWTSGEGSTRSTVAYADTGRAWIAAGSPLAEPGRLPEAARAFVDHARSRGRRACFFACEAEAMPGFGRLLLGEQPLWTPAAWRASVATHRSLREQIRRVRAKGVTIRPVRSAEVAPGTALRERVESLARQWLASRRMAPMGFLVALEPFHLPEEHRYLVAEREGEVVGFVSAIPVYARRGWLVEDVVRDAHAPNGTTEALLDALMSGVEEDHTVTLGLSPLSGAVPRWLRIVRFISRPMFDFTGLRAFRQRLRPARWQSVWLVYPDSEWSAAHVVESLRAFARGSLVSFAVASIVRRPSGPPWALALPLVPWTLLLVGLAATGHANLVGFSSAALAAWAAYDAALAILLFWSALRPRRFRLALAATAASIDAGASLPHLVVTGLGRTLATFTMRGLAAAAPCLGAAVLGWLAIQARRRPSPV